MSEARPPRTVAPDATFEHLLVDAGNRVAAAAARRAAESPGSSYNPLVICGPTGVGKSHLLQAVLDLARKLEPETKAFYEPLDALVERLTESISGGRLQEFRDALAGLDLLLLDDLEHAAGKVRTQEEILSVVEEMLQRGAQLVVASSRPPHEIPAFDARLVTLLGTGLNVDIAPPERETREALALRFAGEGGASLTGSVAAALAALPFESAHDLRGAVNRLLAEAEIAGRALTPDEVGRLLGADEPPAGTSPDEFDGFFNDISTAVAAVVETAPWRRRIAQAILRWEGDGIRTRRLEAALDADAPPDVEDLLNRFARDVGRLRQIRDLLPEPPRDPELLLDPDRLPEAEAIARRHEPPGPASPVPEAPPTTGAVQLEAWYLDPEKLAWNWLALEERVMEEKG